MFFCLDKMSTTIETLPNEIFIHVFSYVAWYDMLTCFWSLNKRFDSLICSTLSRNDDSFNSGIVISNGLSYKKCSTVLFPLIFSCSSLCSSIQRIHFDGKNSNGCHLFSEFLFDENNLLRFPNLKTVVITQCESMMSTIESLSYLIEYQLENLTLSFAHYGLQKMFHVGERTIYFKPSK